MESYLLRTDFAVTDKQIAKTMRDLGSSTFGQLPATWPLRNLETSKERLVRERRCRIFECSSPQDYGDARDLALRSLEQSVHIQRFGLGKDLEKEKTGSVDESQGNNDQTRPKFLAPITT